MRMTKAAGIFIAIVMVAGIAVWSSQFLGVPLRHYSSTRSSVEFGPSQSGINVAFFKASPKPFYSTTETSTGGVSKAWENALPKWGNASFAGFEFHWNAHRLWFRGNAASSVDYVGRDWGATIPVWFCFSVVAVLTLVPLRMYRSRRQSARGFEVERPLDMVIG
jgi:hypothetical protein